MVFEKYVRKGFSELAAWSGSFVMNGVSVSSEDIAAGSPKLGDMIARNPKNHKDVWLVAKKYFEDNLELAPKGRTLQNTDASDAKKSAKDVVSWGDGDTFKLISKVSSEAEGWMKSTKAMQAGRDVVVQVSTQQRNPDGSYAVAEALATVNNAKIIDIKDGDTGDIITRKIVSRQTCYDGM